MKDAVNIEEMGMEYILLETRIPVVDIELYIAPVECLLPTL